MSRPCRFSPPPCGEGGGVGVAGLAAVPQSATPHPDPPPQGGREKNTAWMLSKCVLMAVVLGTLMLLGVAPLVSAQPVPPAQPAQPAPPPPPAAPAQPRQSIVIGFVEIEGDARYEPIVGSDRIVLKTRAHPFAGAEVGGDEAGA